VTGRARKHSLLGGDPGLATFGLVGIETDGFVHQCQFAEVFTSQKLVDTTSHFHLTNDRLRRTRELTRWFGGRLDDSRPTAFIAEAMSFPHSHNAVVMMSLAWGVIVAELERRSIPLISAQPFRWRQSLVESGDEAASWRAAIAMIPSFADRALHIPRDLQEHALDGLGVLCWGVRTNAVRSAVR
jgi:Holliday junction resolvasome RuvABC endonuclease subunit